MIVSRDGETKIVIQKSACTIATTTDYAKMENAFATTASRVISVKNQYARTTATIEVYATKGSVIALTVTTAKIVQTF